ncbi:MAG TPA: hypothetical protein DEH25_11990 [Chloroflexi bacterium]|nr:hypothetical protein [Chloroflexota bacterium]HBY08249.1 hypothetical protein [Chloroflexota bacterium]
MPKKLKVQGPASWTILIFGVIAFLLGIVGIINPEFILRTLGFEFVARANRANSDYTLVFIVASSMASLNMGVYYILAAINNVRKFYGWTVPFRCLTFIVFSTVVLSGNAPIMFLGIAAWELSGAIATGIALYYEKKSGIDPMAGSPNVAKNEA